MAFNKESNGYTFLFAIILIIVVGAGLAALSIGLKDKQQANIEIKNKTFIEFGVEDFFESNCRFLLQKDNWSGFVIDGSSRKIQRLKASYFYWKHALNAQCSFITRENINQLLSISGFDKDVVSIKKVISKNAKSTIAVKSTLEFCFLLLTFLPLLSPPPVFNSAII